MTTLFDTSPRLVRGLRAHRAFFDHRQAVFVRHGVVPQAVREPADHPVLLAEAAQGRALALQVGRDDLRESLWGAAVLPPVPRRD